MNVRQPITALVYLAVAAAMSVALAGCLTSESHWGDSTKSNSNTNSDSNNATTNNTSVNNQSTSNNGAIDAGTNADVGGDGSCFASRFDQDSSLLVEARCVPDNDGLTCTCFDGTTQSSSTGLCEENLIDLCGATADELGSCIADANTCIETTEGFSCTCAAAPAVTSVAETCAQAMWESCYAGKGCGDETAGCQAGDPQVYQCMCDGLANRPVDALRCEDALQVCSVGATFDGCTTEAGTCDRKEGGYDCYCAVGPEFEILDDDPEFDTCEAALEQMCPA